MFPRSLRLSRAGFDQSRKLPRKTTPHFSISYGEASDSAGIGIIVPKKAVKGAVDRHKLKRRVREIARVASKQERLPATMVISARTGAAELPYDTLTKELSNAFKAILAESTSAT